MKCVSKYKLGYGLFVLTISGTFFLLHLVSGLRRSLPISPNLLKFFTTLKSYFFLSPFRDGSRWVLFRGRDPFRRKSLGRLKHLGKYEFDDLHQTIIVQKIKEG